MANQGPPQSSLPPSLGPGARPIEAGDNVNSRTVLAQLWDKSSYKVQVDLDYLTLKYKRDDNTPFEQQLNFNDIPLSPFKKWILYGGPQRAYSSGIWAISTIRLFEQLARRDLTSREVEGVVCRISNNRINALTATTIGCLTGSTIAWNTRENMKFPFRTAQPLEKYNKFPNRYLPILQGSIAQNAWQLTRANVWAAVCVMAIRPLFEVMGNYAMWAGLSKDDRTKDLYLLIEANKKEIREKGISAYTRRPSQTQPNNPQDDPQNQPFGQDQGDSRDHVPQDWDREAFSKSDSDTSNSRRAGDFKPTGPIPPQVGGRINPPSSPNRNSPPANPDVFFDDDDDASPTGGQGLRPELQSGSAWDRIRKGETSGRSNQPAQTQGYAPNSHSHSTETPRGWRRPGTQQDTQFENSVDSFSFSKTEADKQFAREQAQKDFDNMLDRERRQSGSDEYDRGMKAVESGQENPANSGMSVWEQRRRKS